jgi:hypothetical protein
VRGGMVRGYGTAATSTFTSVATATVR